MFRFDPGSTAAVESKEDLEAFLNPRDISINLQIAESKARHHLFCSNSGILICCRRGNYSGAYEIYTRLLNHEDLDVNQIPKIMCNRAVCSLRSRDYQTVVHDLSDSTIQTLTNETGE